MLLEIQDLYGGYGGRDVVRGVSCQADAGDILCLLGPNGCGKTTLFRLVLGALPIRRGSVRIDGREVSSLPPRALANLAAYIPQAHAPVFAYTALEIVMMGRASHFSAFDAPKAVDRDAAFAALEQHPSTFEDFLKILEASGVEVTRRGKSINFRVPGQKSRTRCNTLKGDYTEQAIRERIAGTYIPSVQPKRSNSSVRMLIDIDAAMRAGKGAGYERCAKVFNVKQLAKAVAYLKEHGDMSYEDLQAKAQATTSRFNELSTQIKDMESRLSQNGELQKQIVNYSKTRSVYIAYRKAGYSKKFRAEHEADILIHPAAKKYFDSLGVEKLPTVKTLREEYAEVLEAKRKAYAEYKQVREEMRELQNVKANIDYLLGPSAERTQEKEHS